MQYWSHEQTTIHPIIVYTRDAAGELWAQSHVFISPDRKHDNRFVTHCVKELIGRLHAEGNAPKRIMFWSDGCKAQYQYKRQFYFISQPHLDVPEYQMGHLDQLVPVTDASGKQKVVRLPISMAHSFFCSCHGKGPSDGETGRYKTKARDLEAGGLRIPLPKDFTTSSTSGWAASCCAARTSAASTPSSAACSTGCRAALSSADAKSRQSIRRRWRAR